MMNEDTKIYRLFCGLILYIFQSVMLFAEPLAVEHKNDLKTSVATKVHFYVTKLFAQVKQDIETVIQLSNKKNMSNPEFEQLVHAIKRLAFVAAGGAAVVGVGGYFIVTSVRKVLALFEPNYFNVLAEQYKTIPSAKRKIVTVVEKYNIPIEDVNILFALETDNVGVITLLNNRISIPETQIDWNELQERMTLEDKNLFKALYFLTFLKKPQETMTMQEIFSAIARNKIDNRVNKIHNRVWKRELERLQKINDRNEDLKKQERMYQNITRELEEAKQKEQEQQKQQETERKRLFDQRLKIERRFRNVIKQTNVPVETREAWEKKLKAIQEYESRQKSSLDPIKRALENIDREIKVYETTVPLYKKFLSIVGV